MHVYMWGEQVFKALAVGCEPSDMLESILRSLQEHYLLLTTEQSLHDFLLPSSSVLN